jgi:hypothetical protein
MIASLLAFAAYLTPGRSGVAPVHVPLQERAE